jgi:hypothetical protein
MRNEEFDLTGAECELEQALGRIRPAAHAISRERVMFEAGRASMRGRLYAWRAAAAVLALGMGLILGLGWVGRGGRHPVAEPMDLASEAATFSPVAAASTPALDDFSYAMVRSRVLRDGVEALPAFGSTERWQVHPGGQQRLHDVLQQPDT